MLSQLDNCSRKYQNYYIRAPKNLTKNRAGSKNVADKFEELCAKFLRKRFDSPALISHIQHIDEEISTINDTADTRPKRDDHI